LFAAQIQPRFETIPQIKIFLFNSHNIPLTVPSTAQTLYNSQKAGITSAIVICILLPLGICAFCLIVHFRNKNSEGYDDQDPRPARAAEGRTNVGQRFGADRSSGNSSASGKKGQSDSDRDSGFHANGRVTTASARNHSIDDVRYNSERFQRTSAPERQDSLKAGKGILKAGSGGSKAESYSGSQASSASDLVDLETPPQPGARPKAEPPTLEDVVRNRPPVARLPSSSGRSTPSSPSSPTGSSLPATSISGVPQSQSDDFRPKQPLRGSGRSTSSERLLADQGKPSSVPLLSQGPLGSAPRQPASAATSSPGSSFRPDPSRGSGRSTSSSVASGAVPKAPAKAGPGSRGSSSASSPPPPPMPSSLPPPMTSDSEEETDVNPSDFDGSYYTNEPLVNKPRVDFPAKPLEADIDVKNYKPFSVPAKKPSAL
jgi:hypothetical protein